MFRITKLLNILCFVFFLMIVNSCSDEKAIVENTNKSVNTPESRVLQTEDIIVPEEVTEGAKENENIRCLSVFHAGGITPDGTIETNSLDAINNTYLNGGRYLELDLCWTSDSKLVCIHDCLKYTGTKNIILCLKWDMKTSY